MSNLTLGLDLGSTSIGWALLRSDGPQQGILYAGVRVFPEGVDRDQQGGEKSKAADRRTTRGMRRQVARRARRKRQLRELLIKKNLLPGTADELEDVLALNPYPLRARATKEELSPYEIGRILIHINQRRGFLSNRKTDKAKAKKAKGMLAEISALANAMAGQTLGEYLNQVGSAFDHRRRGPEPTEKKLREGQLRDTVRRLHTRRSMYIDEFEAMWGAQRRYHPDILTDELKLQLYNPEPDENWVCRGIIFGQRKMYWPKSVVGRCELTNLKRCPKADRAAQRFRLLQEANNLRITDTVIREERGLTPDERSTVIDYLNSAKEKTFDQIRKELFKKHGLPEHVRFNYERAERTKLKGHETDAALSSKKALGKAWSAISDDTRDAIVNILINEDKEDVALLRLTNECCLSREDAERALATSLPDGYLSYSREAIVRLLPYLERGLHLMADDASNSALHAAGYLRPDEREVRQREFLPPAPDLPNPLVRQAVVEVRKLVNAIIREYGRPDAIHIELAREAKKSLDERTQIRIDNARRRDEREEAAEEIRKMGFDPTGADKNRYRLWKEQAEDCVYCGNKISQAQLFGGEVDIDHVLPRWRSLDNSMANKVVCHRKCNNEKGDRTPREWLEDSNPERYERVLRLADKLPYNKRRKFILKDIVLDEFVQRQLKDTQYITRLVTQYLKCLGAKIVTLRGQMTAELRHYWGLNTILDAEGRGEKNRADHRHHAIDAVVIALTDHKRLFALANDRGKDVTLPWPVLRDDVARIIAEINVSQRAQRRLYGALHEDFFYGPTLKPWKEASPSNRPWAAGWIEQDGAYVRRKAITEIKNRKHLEKVRDETIREILREHLRRLGIDPDQSTSYPSTTFKGENTPRMPSGVPIKKVRMIEEGETFRVVSERRHYHCVKPGNNHHIVYRSIGEGDKQKWAAEVVTMWDAARRGRSGLPLVDLSDKDGAKFVMSLAIGEAFQIDGPQGNRLLCVVQKMRQDDRRINYKLHTDAREAKIIVKDNLCLSPDRLRQLNARKVVVDPLGRIRWAND